MLLLCKNDKDQHAINNSGFVLCGDYLCWQYPERASVNVLNMSRLNSIRLKTTRPPERAKTQLIIDKTNRGD